MIGRMIICCLLCALNAAAQGQTTLDSIITLKSELNLMERLQLVQQYLDTKAKAAVQQFQI